MVRMADRIDRTIAETMERWSDRPPRPTSQHIRQVLEWSYAQHLEGMVALQHLIYYNSLVPSSLVQPFSIRVPRSCAFSSAIEALLTADPIWIRLPWGKVFFSDSAGPDEHHHSVNDWLTEAGRQIFSSEFGLFRLGTGEVMYVTRGKQETLRAVGRFIAISVAHNHSPGVCLSDKLIGGLIGDDNFASQQGGREAEGRLQIMWITGGFREIILHKWLNVVSAHGLHRFICHDRGFTGF